MKSTRRTCFRRAGEMGGVAAMVVWFLAWATGALMDNQ